MVFSLDTVNFFKVSEEKNKFNISSTIAISDKSNTFFVNTGIVESIADGIVGIQGLPGVANVN